MTSFNIYHSQGKIPSTIKRKTDNSRHASNVNSFNSINNLNNLNNNQSAHVNFKGGFFSANELAKKNIVLKMGEMAQTRSSLFEALFAVALTCGLRPATIVVTPDKSDKKDKQFAAAQSISSGLVGLVIGKLLQDPFATAGKNLVQKVNVARIQTLYNQESGFKAKCAELGLEGKKFKDVILSLNSEIEKQSVPHDEAIKKLQLKKLQIIDEKKYNKELIQTKVKDLEQKIKDEKERLSKTIHNFLGVKSDSIVKELGEKDKPVTIKDLNLAESIKSIADEITSKKPQKAIVEMQGETFGKVLKEFDLKEKLKYLLEAKRYKNYDVIACGYGPKLYTTPILAVLTIGAISPIVKKLFKDNPKAKEKAGSEKVAAKGSQKKDIIANNNNIPTNLKNKNISVRKAG